MKTSALFVAPLSGALPIMAMAASLAMAPLASAQVYVPAASAADPLEANTRISYPLMRAASRSQYVIAASEVGPATTLHKLLLRYDGNGFGAAGGTIANLDIYLANSTVTPSQSSSQFATNYPGDPTLVLSLTNFTFGADDSINHVPWGGPSGEFIFNFTTPFVYTGGTLIVEIRASGNTNSGNTVEDCLLDAEVEAQAGPFGGEAFTNGTGCYGASMSASGQMAPGGSIAVSGTGLGANSPVMAMIGASRTSWNGLPLPLSLGFLGLSGCSIYNDWSLTWPMLADPNGVIAPYSSGAVLDLPASTALVGGVLQFQMVSIQPGINPLGLAMTNNTEVFLGVFATPNRGYMGHFHHLDSDAPVASISTPVILAMRFNQ